MKPLSNEYLLTTAQIAATLIGLLVVGLYYFLETGLGQLQYTRPLIQPLIRAMSKLILLLFSFVLGVSLGLVALAPVWLKVLFLGIAVYFFPAAVGFTSHAIAIRRTFKGSLELLIYVVVTWLWLLVIVSIPWVLGGWSPTRSHYGWSLFLAGFLAFVQTLGLFLLSFDLRDMEEALRASKSRTRK